MSIDGPPRSDVAPRPAGAPRLDGPPRSDVALPGGLVLRTYRPTDLDQVGELLTVRGEAHDAVDHRLVVTDPDLGPQACAVVVDGDRVVATATLLDETVRVAGVDLPAGQVELVAVAESHEHRGLARALMGWAHERSAARGHLLQVMIGIPYFYRLFGYAYAIDIAPARDLLTPPGPPAASQLPDSGEFRTRHADGPVHLAPLSVSPASPPPDSGGFRTRHADGPVYLAPLSASPASPPPDSGALRTRHADGPVHLAPLGEGESGAESGAGVESGVRLRPAAGHDVPELTALQAAAQAGADVLVPHPEARWRALLAHTSSRTVVLERAGRPVASARVRDDGDGLLVAEPAALDPAAADALLAALAADGRPLRVVHRAGTVTGRSWDHLLAPADDGAEQYYVRLADPAAVLDALRPVLAARAAAAELAPDDLVVSTFGAHYRLPWTDGGFGPVEVGGPMQSPGEHGGFGVAPDRLAALLLGPGFSALRRLAPDVYGPQHGAALFPPTTADVLSYYLPW